MTELLQTSADGGLLEGRTAFVSGAAQGIGLAVTRAFLAQGASVAMADVQADAVRRAAAGFAEEFGERTLALALDVTDEPATERAADAVVERFGKVDIVVPNADVLLLRHALDIGLDEWRRVIDVNLTGAFISATVLARRMVAQGGGGRIIFTSSLFGLRGGRENAAYSASKFGVVGLAQSMAAELAPDGVLVNCVCPGQMDTAMIRQLFRERAALTGIPEEEVRAALERRIPAGHLGPLSQLAGTYLYLASPLSDYVTGQSITVDGGWQVG